MQHLVFFSSVVDLFTYIHNSIFFHSLLDCFNFFSHQTPNNTFVMGWKDVEYGLDAMMECSSILHMWVIIEIKTWPADINTYFVKGSRCLYAPVAAVSEFLVFHKVFLSKGFYVNWILQYIISVNVYGSHLDILFCEWNWRFLDLHAYLPPILRHYLIVHTSGWPFYPVIGLTLTSRFS